MGKAAARLASLVQLHSRRFTAAAHTYGIRVTPTMYPSSGRAFFHSPSVLSYDAAVAAATQGSVGPCPVPGRATLITASKKLPADPLSHPDASADPHGEGVGGSWGDGGSGGGGSGGIEQAINHFGPRYNYTTQFVDANPLPAIVAASHGPSSPSWLDPGPSLISPEDAFDDALPLPRKSYRFDHAAHGFPKPSRHRRPTPASSPAPNPSPNPHPIPTILGAMPIPPSSSASPASSASSASSSPAPQSKYLSVGCGEDAYFHRHDALGVADGVGGWSGTQGANPAEFSRKIMHYACAELEKYDDVDEEAFGQYYEVEPVEILERSFAQASRDAQEEGIIGSTTACLAILRDDELRVANLGDCGLTVVRAGHFVFRTEEQQHSFNFPYQLGTGSPDRPSDAQSFRVRVQRGDVIILGSDGIFDNLFDEDILETVRQCVTHAGLAGTGSSAQENAIIDAGKVSEGLARRARDVSEDSRCGASPFQSRAIAEGLYYSGGKMDDISVVVAIVADQEDTPDRR